MGDGDDAHDNVMDGMMPHISLFSLLKMPVALGKALS